MKEETKVKFCTQLIRLGLEFVPCGEVLQSPCPNRAVHKLPFPTGFCNSGWHEGDKVDKPTCKEYLTCECKCHQDLWFMFTISEADRMLMDNSTWRPLSTFVMPSQDERIREQLLSSKPDREAPVVLQSPAPGIVPDAIAHIFDPTPTGRAARGELETWVREITDVFAVEEYTDLHFCTPQFISEQIARRHGLGRPPSTGAVDAVLKRWEKIGFANLGRKPTRFTAYTEVGVKFGLDFMKAKARTLQ